MEQKEIVSIRQTKYHYGNLELTVRPNTIMSLFINDNHTYTICRNRGGGWSFSLFVPECQKSFITENFAYVVCKDGKRWLKERIPIEL